MINKCYDKFEHDLSVLSENNIHSLNTLRLTENKSLYNSLWLSAHDFISKVVFRTSTNRSRISEISTLGINVEDLGQDVLLRFVTKIDLVLKKPLGAQLPYVCLLVNNLITDVYRKRIKEVSRTVSIHGKLINNTDNEDLEFQIVDSQANTESKYITKEHITTIISLLSHKPDELLAYICVDLLKQKPQTLANALSERSEPEVLAKALYEISAEYDLNIHAVIKHLANSPDNTLSNDRSQNKKQIGAPQISRLTYRAKQKVSQHITFF